MRILVTGATGFLGHPIARSLVLKEHDLVVLSRSAERARETFPYPAEFHDWDPQGGPPSAAALAGVDAIIHLAGESVAGRRWTEEQKRRIRDSRVLGTRHLWQALARERESGRPLPKAFVSASAIGIYGDRGDEPLDEDSAPGEGFLAQVCKDWETEIFAPGFDGVRKAALRVGVVLGREGGALEKLLPVFGAGVGGPVGGGKQWMSWIHVEDLAAAFVAAAEDPRFGGAINAVAPEPVTNREFSRALGSALGKPAFLPAPAAALKAALGEMASVVLASQRVAATRLQGMGFKFAYPQLATALQGICAPGGDARDEEFVAEQWVPRTPEEIFPYFSEARNLEGLTPPFLGFRIERVSTPDVREGTLIDYKLKIHGVPASWRTRIEEWEPNAKFVDTQLSGPYSKWHHTHSFIPAKGGTLLRDRVLYRLPLGGLGKVARGFVRKDVERIFAYRRKRIRELFT